MGNTEGNSGKIREPVIVVSDVHLGGKSSHCEDFRDFLGWLNTLSDNGTSVDCNGINIDIKKGRYHHAADSRDTGQRDLTDCGKLPLQDLTFDFATDQ